MADPAPGNPLARARVLLSVRRPKEALALIADALAAEPASPEAHGLAAEAHLQLRAFDDAERHAREAIRASPGASWAHTLLGNALYEKKDLEGARGAFFEAQRCDPRAAEPLVWLASTFLALGGPANAAEAERAARRALALAPENAGAHGNLSLALEALGRLPEAVAGFRRVLELNPEDALTHYHLGRIYTQAQRYDRAQASYAEALRLDPEFSEAGRALEQARTLTFLRRPVAPPAAPAPAAPLPSPAEWAAIGLGLVAAGLVVRTWPLERSPSRPADWGDGIILLYPLVATGFSWVLLRITRGWIRPVAIAGPYLLAAVLVRGLAARERPDLLDAVGVGGFFALGMQGTLLWILRRRRARREREPRPGPP